MTWQSLEELEIGYDQLQAENEKLKVELAEANREASSLAMSIWRGECQKKAPNFGLCDSVAGIITQIDNMYAGIRNQRDTFRFELAALRAQGPVIPEGFVLVPKGFDLWRNTNGAVNKMLADKQKYDPAMLAAAPQPRQLSEEVQIRQLQDAVMMYQQTQATLEAHNQTLRLAVLSLTERSREGSEAYALRAVAVCAGGKMPESALGVPSATLANSSRPDSATQHQGPTPIPGASPL